jgi:hypothetical protein
LTLQSDKEEIFRQRQRTFVGKVMARFSADMQDHMANIQESKDQLGHLLAQTTSWPQEDHERFDGILSTIGRHLNLLSERSEHVRRSGQRTGVQFETFDAGDVVEEAVSFSTRLARSRRISLERQATETSPRLYSDPVRALLLVMGLIHHMLERVTRGGKVIVGASLAENGVLIEIEGHGTEEAMASPSPEEENPDWLVAEHLLDDLGGRLQTEAMGTEIGRMALFLPAIEAAKAPQV